MSLAAEPPKPEVVPAPPNRDRNNTFRKPAPRRALGANIEEDDDNDDPYQNVDSLDIRIDKLDVEIARPSNHKETIGGLMAQGPGGEAPRGRLDASPEEILEGLKREGSAIRPSSKERHNSDGE